MATVPSTFTTNLAGQLKFGLQALDPALNLASRPGDPGVYVHGVDALASAVIKRAGADIGPATEAVLGASRSDLNHRAGDNGWQEALATAGNNLPEKLRSTLFLSGEYEHVVLVNGITQREDYLRVRRPGRGVRLNRSDRNAVWDVVERYRAGSKLAGTVDFAEATAIAARHLMLTADSAGRLADHVLVDEGQDLSPLHWQLIRALVTRGPDDIFMAEDAHQRIYGKRLVLSRFGIDTRGRSQRLTLNYRTTEQNLKWATMVLDGGEYVDSEDEEETTSGYRSARSGKNPLVYAAPTLSAELDRAADIIRTWLEDTDVQPETIAVLVRGRAQRDRVVNGFQERGVPIRPVDREQVPAGQPVVMTMHRAKGTEFAKVLLFGVSSRDIPTNLSVYRFDEEEAGDAKLRERSLLYVAATRARDELAVTYTGQATELMGRSEV